MKESVMTEKDKIDIYMELFKEYLNRFDLRRSYEWKFNIALWTSILIWIGISLREDIAIESCGQKLMASMLASVHLIIFFVFSFLWSGFLHKSNKYDKDFAFEYKKAIDLYMSSPREYVFGKIAEPNKLYWKALINWSPLSQIMITGILLFISCFVSIEELC